MQGLLLLFLSTFLLAAFGCWINPAENEDLLARCDLKEIPSSEFALRTGLSHVCSEFVSSNTTCLALLLADETLIKSLGVRIEGFPVSGRRELPSVVDARSKDHVDLGFLPRVTLEEFVRLYSWADSAHNVEGGGKALFGEPIRRWNNVAVSFDRGKDQFVIERGSQQ